MENANENPSFYAEFEKIMRENLKKSTDAFIQGYESMKSFYSPGGTSGFSGQKIVDDMIKFNLEVSKILFSHSKEALEEVVNYTRSVYAKEKPKPAAADAKAEEQKDASKIEVSICAERYQEAKSSFVLSNHGQKDLESEFLITPFESEDGHKVSPTAITLAPSSVRIAPGAEQQFDMQINVHGRFNKNKTYHAKINLSRYPDQEIHVRLEVRESQKT